VREEPSTSESLWRALFPSPLITVLMIVVCVAVPAFLMQRFIEHNPQLSPIDESAHLDYVIRATRGEIPRTGDRMTQQSARIITCKGVQLDGLVLPKCGKKHYDVTVFPSAGYQYEAQQPPAYYFATALLRPVMTNVLGIDDYVDGVRATGFVYWSVGLLLLWAAMRVFRVDAWCALAVLLLLACAPDVITYTSIVTNDAASMLVGATCLLGIALALRRPSTAWAIVLAALGLGAALTKTSDVIPVVALAAFALWTLFREHGTLRAAAAPWMRTGGALLAGAVVGTLAWAVIRGQLQYVDPKTMPIAIDNPIHGGFRIGPFLEDLVSLFGPATDSPTSRWVGDPTQRTFIQILRTLLLVGALLGVFVRPRQWFHRLGLSTLAAMIAGGVTLAIGFYVFLNENPETASRYGLAVVPLLGVALAAAAGATNDRRVTIFFGAIALAAFGTTAAVLA
jgi:hypothetical protein